MTALLLFLIAQYAPSNPEWNQPVEPFRVVGNVYYVGASGVSSFLIATPEGHILIDAGFPETAPLVEASVRTLGFRLEDIRILLASHAHFDHTGGLAELKARTKARFLANPVEAGQFARGGKGDFAFGDRYPFPPIEADGLLKDGGSIRLGGAEVTVYFTPGHTRGSTTYTLSVRDGEKTYRVVIAASVTAPGYQLVGNPLYPGIVEDFESTFAKLRALPCDVFLAGHAWEFGLKDRAPDAYPRWLDRSQAAFRKQLDEERKKVR